SARRSATEVAAARVGAATVRVRSVFAASHSAAWTSRVVFPDPGGESMTVTRRPETVSYSALASTDPGTSRCQEGTSRAAVTSSGDGSTRGGFDVSIPRVFRSAALRAMSAPSTGAGYVLPSGRTPAPAGRADAPLGAQERSVEPALWSSRSLRPSRVVASENHRGQTEPSPQGEKDERGDPQVARRLPLAGGDESNRGGEDSAQGTEPSGKQEWIRGIEEAHRVPT